MPVQPNSQGLRGIRPALRLLVILLFTGALLSAHEGHKPLPTKGAQVDVAKGEVILSRGARDALDVKTAEVAVHPVREQIMAYVTLVTPWQKHAYVTTRVAGRITSLNVKPGQTVAAGQPLAEVDSLQLKDITLELLNADNDLDLSSQILKDLESAIRSGSVRERQLVEARSKQQQDLNAMEIARSKWLSLGLTSQSLDDVLKNREPEHVPSLPILSPIAGVVIHVDLTVGKVVDPTEHLFEVVDLSSVWAEIGVLEKDLHRVSVGQAVEFDFAAYPGEVYRSTVQAIGLYLDPETHLGTIWAELPNVTGQEPRLLPGMYGQAQLILPGPEKMLTVPREALIRDGAERYLLVEEAATAIASQLTKKNVVIGRQTSSQVQIIAGQVFPGDRVVTQGAHELAGFFVQGVLRPSPEAIQSIGLRLEPVARHVVEDILEVEGTIDVPPDRRTTTSSQLSGTLQTIRAERGKQVHAGEIIAEMASLELQDLQLDLLKAYLERTLREGIVKHLESIAQSVPKRQILEQKALLSSARNRLENLEQKLESIGLSHEQIQTILVERKITPTLPLRSPIDGVLVRLNKVLGQVIKADEPILEIHDVSRVWVQGYLSVRDLKQVHIGQSARVRLVADPQFLANATVSRSGHIFGTENRTLSVWAELQEKSSLPLQHNMLARLTLTLRRPEPTIAIPLTALVREGTRSYVFAQKSDGTMERLSVDTRRADDRFVEIIRGLQAKDVIAVQGVSELQTAYAAVR